MWFKYCVLLMLVLMGEVQVINGYIQYLVSPSDDECPGGEYECHTLEEYANNSNKYFKIPDESRYSLEFYYGHHESRTPLEISDIKYLRLYSAPPKAEMITSDFIFDGIRQLNLKFLVINGHANNISMTNISSLFIEDIYFRSNGDSSGKDNPQLTIYTSCTQITIYRSSFVDYYVDIVVQECLTNDSINELSISGNTFGVAVLKPREEVQHTSYALLNLTITKTSANIIGGSFTRSGYSGMKATLKKQSTLTLSDGTRVEQNNMCGIHILSSGLDNEIHLQNTRIRYNTLLDMSCSDPTVPNAAGLSVTAQSSSTYKITMENVIFENNQDDNAIPRTVFIYRSENASISNSRFINNHGSAIAIYLSKSFMLSGKTEFINNYGCEGGALLMFTVYLTITDNANITFRDNQAENVGGAICIQNMPIQIDNDQNCFLIRFQSTEPNVSVVFYNNNAEKGGLHIYGATTKTPCNRYLSGTEKGTEFVILEDTFSFYPTCNETSSCVSSEPIRICLCEGNVTKCTDIDHIFQNKTVYPGQSFTLNAMNVGADFGPMAGAVVALLSNDESRLSDFQYAQRIDLNTECRALTYTIHSSEEAEVQLRLSSECSIHNQFDSDKEAISDYIKTYEQTGVIDINLLTTLLYINIITQTCPPGFKLNNDSICDCNKEVKESDENMQCYFENNQPLIKRMKNLWLAPADTHSDELLMNGYCPLYKCWNDTVYLDDPDAQCKANRNGTICGKCKKGSPGVIKM